MNLNELAKKDALKETGNARWTKELQEILMKEGYIPPPPVPKEPEPDEIWQRDKEIVGAIQQRLLDAED